MESQIGYNFFMKLNGKKVAGIIEETINEIALKAIKTYVIASIIFCDKSTNILA